MMQMDKAALGETLGFNLSEPFAVLPDNVSNGCIDYPVSSTGPAELFM